MPLEEVRHAAFGTAADWDELARRHGGLVKPSIVFFGENLPYRFFECARDDLPECTMLLVLGTSLAVHPFAGLVHETRDNVPRFLVNRERVGDFVGPVDGFFAGDCDDAVRQLCEMLGWEADLEAVLTRANAGARRA